MIKINEIANEKPTVTEISPLNLVKLDNIFSGSKVKCEDKNVSQFIEINCDILQKKILRIIFSDIKGTDTELRPVTVTFGQLLDLLNIRKDGRNYERVKEAVFQLARILSCIHNIPVGKEDTYQKTNGALDVIPIFKFVRADYESRYVTFGISDYLKPYLLDLDKKYFYYKLGNVLNLKRTYSISLYEWLKSHQGQGSFVAKVETIQSVLFGDKIPKTYLDKRDFFDKVIFPSINEINTNTDINVSFEKNYTSAQHHYSTITFNVKQKSDEEFNKIKKEIWNVKDEDLATDEGKIKQAEELKKTQTEQEAFKEDFDRSLDIIANHKKKKELYPEMNAFTVSHILPDELANSLSSYEKDAYRAVMSGRADYEDQMIYAGIMEKLNNLNM